MVEEKRLRIRHARSLRLILLIFFLELWTVPAVCQTAREEPAQFIRTYQSAVFREQGLEPESYRKQELELLEREIPDVASAISRHLDELPSEYEHPLFLVLSANMSTISKIGSGFLERTLDTPVDAPPIIATVPVGFATPVTTWHPASRRSILWFDAASHTFLLELSKLVAQSIPVANGSADLSFSGIRSQINRNKELNQSFQALLEAYVYDADLRKISPFATDGPHQPLAIDRLYRPSMIFVLAHEYTHAALHHAIDPKELFPPDRKDFSNNFYSQANENMADTTAFFITHEAGFREADVLAGAWLFLKGEEILTRALAVAATNNEFSFGNLGVPTPSRLLFGGGCSDHPLPDIRLTMLEVAARTAWGPKNDDLFAPAYTVDWIFEYLWRWARPQILQRYKNGDRPARHWMPTINCLQHLEP